jgi:hypothetical protein
MKLLKRAACSTYSCAHAKAHVDVRIVRYGLNSVFGVGSLIECTTAVPPQVLISTRLHLGGISAANTDGVVVSIGNTIGAL